MQNRHLLVLHGPHLDWLGEAPLSGQPTLHEVDRALELALGASAEVRIAQGSSEAELVTAVHRARGWASHAIVSPAALAPTCYVLREALALLQLPFAEVFVEELPGTAEHAQKSLLRSTAELQLRGSAPAVYLEAAERLLGAKMQRTAANATAASAARADKQIGRTAPRKAAPSAPVVAKTIGHVQTAKPTRNNTGISRAVVRQQIIDRLAGRISAAQLATWSREQWLAVEGGAATEAGQRELLAEALQALALSTAGAGLSEPALLDWMARMG